MKPISRSELAALVDLGLPDDVIAKYLVIDVPAVAELRQRHHIAQAGNDTNRARGAPVSGMREQARRLIAVSRSSTDPFQQRDAAERAFDLAQLAESEERRLLDIAARHEDDASAPAQEKPADPASHLEKARQWRMRAEEYWTVSEAMQTPLAREIYAHLARSYERLADQFEARAQGLAKERKPRSG